MSRQRVAFLIRLREKLNCLNIYCRLIDLHFPPKSALKLATWYEKHLQPGHSKKRKEGPEDGNKT